jgi:hypothetical protein
VLPSVEQRHIEHNNVNTLFFGEFSPLILNVLIISPHAVYALDIQQIARFLSG